MIFVSSLVAAWPWMLVLGAAGLHAGYWICVAGCAAFALLYHLIHGPKV